MNTPPLIRNTLLAVIALSGISCASTRYIEPAGENLPIVEASTPVRIVSIGGQSTRQWKRTPAQRFHVTPGRHVVEVFFTARASDIAEELGWVDQGDHPVAATGTSQLLIDAKPGETYSIHHRLEWDRIRLNVSFFVPVFGELPATP